MKFYCIVNSLATAVDKPSYKYLQAAVAAKGHDFITLEANDFDYVKDIDSIETPSMLYRLGTGKRTSMLEVLLQKKGVVGFHKDLDTLLGRQFEWGAAIRLQKAGLPSIPSVLNVSQYDDARLAEYVEHLGGFPVIVKSSGGSHGVGVMKVDSIESLRSVIGFVAGHTSADIALRQFVHSARHIRVVVIGDEAADTIEYDPQDGDFRTNAVAVPTVVDRNDLDDAYKKIATDAVKALDLEFGGVDLLIDTSGSAYIAEVNYPCNFSRNQMNTHTDVAAKMVDYLYAKAGQAS